MSLALLPITALLLLLSGGTVLPVHAGGAPRSAAALVNALFGKGSAAVAQSTSRRKGQKGVWWRTGLPQRWFAAGHRRSERLLAATVPRPENAGGNCKPYRARFGFAEGALQPQGPPAAFASLPGPCALLG